MTVDNVVGFAILFGVAAWVYRDAKAIGDNKGQTPGLVKTQPTLWVIGILLICIVVFPIYLLMRVRYKRQLAEKIRAVALLQQGMESRADEPGVWPPPPQGPTA